MNTTFQSPFTIQAESYNSMSGITNGGSVIGSADTNDWVKYSQVNLGSGYSLFTANVGVPASNAGKTAEIRLDSTTGTLVGTLTIQSTGGYSTLTQQTTALTGANGVHDVYIVFKGGAGVGNFDWFKFGNPYTIQAESYNDTNNTSCAIIAGTVIKNCNDGDWVVYKKLDLGSGYGYLTANVGVPASNAGKTAEIRLDSPTGTLAGTLTLQSTGNYSSFLQQTVALTGASGVHDVYIVFKGGSAIGSFDWFRFTNSNPIVLQAESYSSMSGINNGGTVIGSCDNGDWVAYSQVNLGSGYNLFTANAGVPASNAGKTAEIRLDSTTGTLVGTLTIQSTGGYSVYTEQSTALTGASGVHDIYIVFNSGSGVGNFDWIKFSN
ncbi:hypothetical protein ASG93_19180 [Paenibacillus sp. Soil787]|nr:hypothetical protein ASG93_19180 [Paenibacillus sp. Soil787]